LERGLQLCVLLLQFEEVLLKLYDFGLTSDELLFTCIDLAFTLNNRILVCLN
jgi:hypothetical protein